MRTHTLPENELSQPASHFEKPDPISAISAYRAGQQGLSDFLRSAQGQEIG